MLIASSNPPEEMSKETKGLQPQEEFAFHCPCVQNKEDTQADAQILYILSSCYGGGGEREAGEMRNRQVETWQSG